MTPLCVVSTNPRINFCVIVAQNGGLVVRLSGALDFMPNNNIHRYVEERPTILPCKVRAFLNKKRGITLQQAMDFFPSARW